MKLLLLFIIGMFSVAQCILTDAEIDRQWNDFKTKFERNYADEKEENQRKQIFTQTLQQIEEHNQKHAKGEVSYTLGINQFADKTPEEIRPYTHGVRIPENKQN